MPNICKIKIQIRKRIIPRLKDGYQEDSLTSTQNIEFYSVASNQDLEKSTSQPVVLFGVILSTNVDRFDLISKMLSYRHAIHVAVTRIWNTLKWLKMALSKTHGVSPHCGWVLGRVCASCSLCRRKALVVFFRDSHDFSRILMMYPVWIRMAKIKTMKIL